MIPEERLTAYALNEVDAPERAEIEAHLAADPDAQKCVEAIRTLGAQLTTSLAIEAEPATITTVAPPRRTWKPAYAVLAASLLIAASVGIYALGQKNEQPKLAANKLPSTNTYEYAPHAGQSRVVREALGDLPRDESTRKHYRKLDSANGSLESKNEKDLALVPPTVITPLVIPPDISKKLAGSTTTAVPGAGPMPTNPFAPAPSSAMGRPPVGAYGGIGGLPPQGKPQSPAARSAIVPSPNVMDPVAGADKSKESSGRGGSRPPLAAGRSYDRFPALVENDFVKVEGQAALSTFGVDVDTASYSIMRKFLRSNQLPPPGAVRLEEMVNYFPYRDAAPSGNDPFAVTVEVAECPWQPKNRLARIGLKAKPINYKNRPASNLVFLIDVSGSMNQANKLPLVKESMKMLVGELGENDRVAMVVYAGASGLVLDSTSAMHKPEILDALDRLQAGGSTNGASGIQLAYDVAVSHFIEGGTNRVILCTDGDWNVGTTSTDALIALIEAKRKTNVFLSVCGFGMGNLRDEMMVNLAGKGNGQYYYIDTAREAHKSFVETLGGTLVTVAKDVKIQVEFNPAKVGAYRLLGYEKRKLAAEDFHNDAKDAGEMGAGHVVTALYELTPPGSDVAAGVDGLRYQQAAKPLAKASDSTEAFVVKLRHKLPESDVSTLREVPVTDSNKPYGEASEDFRFAASVASYAMLLRDSPYKGVSTYGLVAELANAAKSWDPGAYRTEFVKLVEKAKAVSGKP